MNQGLVLKKQTSMLCEGYLKCQQYYKNNSRTVFGQKNHMLLCYMVQHRCNKNKCMYRIKLLLLTVLVKNHMAVTLSAWLHQTQRLPADDQCANSLSFFAKD